MRNASDQRGPGVWRALAFLTVLATGLGSTACDFLDPTNVENPRTTGEDLAQAQEPTAALLPGLEAQFARLLEATVVATECVSDNYSIQGTGLEASWDFPEDVTPSVTNGTGGDGFYWHAQELAALASFILDDIVPDDETATASDMGWAHYYRGMARLHMGENFTYAPIEESGA
ncbi:MAG: hypothetical protein KAJ42_01620, partial [Gemmatimonadetes bacterium]|nr:hypothetical protein [Gemmatimonadota bacterium]